ncbi:hypothetical protein [Kosakonia cowanii]|uniref:hypothetical protein n=1 Tax=Kosakonia cowanii TaxID=208223 RepID=UPI0022E89CAE|nr:hypothetical protein [Kosakonia cowanii]
MANFRIKAAGNNNSVLTQVLSKILSQNHNKDVLFLVSQISIAKNDDRIKQILGGNVFNQLVKKRTSFSATNGINFELQTYDYLKNSNHRAHGRTVVVLNPSTQDLDAILQNSNSGIDWIAVEMTLDGELDSWVHTNQATDI